MPSKDNNPPITTQTSEIKYENPWIAIHEDTVTFPSGKKGIYGYLESKDSVMVVAVNTEEKVYLVKAFRYPTKTWGWELPGGSTDGEDPIAASKRELEEETGMRAATWHNLGSPLVCNGLMTERMTVALALDCSFSGTTANDDETFLDKGFFSVKEVKDMIRNGEIDDGQTLSGLYLYQLWKESNHA